MAQNAFGVTLQRFGDYARGASLLAETLEGWRRLGETRIVAQTTSNLAILSRLRGDYAGAMALFQECLSLFSEIGDRAGVGWCLSNIGDVERDQGRFADARRHYEESLAAFHAAGDEVGQAATLLDLGEVHFALGDRQPARETEARAFDLVRRRGLREARTAVRVLEASALRAWDDGRPRDALVFAGAAAVTRRGASTRFDERYAGRLDDVVAAARSRLGESAGAAWMEGWALSIDEALARAFAAK
jgi:tetratricopeptide (TPR) repeat protein